ncbi:MAG: VOC family protein [Gemmatimonadota bacterium]|nr:VOC family protein [Gemmatimonadota bacterium]
MKTDAVKKQGTPNWADCATTDLDAAEKFYTEVFGWTPERVEASDGGTYSVQRLDGAMVAGIYELNEQMRGMGVPPHWGTYIEVDDVDAALEKVKAQGGAVMDEPVEEPEVGKIAIIQDPVGAFVRLWHSEPGHGGQVFNVPGSMSWNELMTDDPEKAAKFYEEVLGVQSETMDEPMPYTTLKVDGRAVAGILKKTPEMGNAPTSWDVYFASDDVDATAEAVTRAGGKAIKEPFDIMGGAGRMAVFQDPGGAVFEVIKMPVAEG